MGGHPEAYRGQPLLAGGDPPGSVLLASGERQIEVIQRPQDHQRIAHPGGRERAFPGSYPGAVEPDDLQPR